MITTQTNGACATFFREIFPEYYGFILSRAIYVITKLQVADAIKKRPMTLSALAQHLGTTQVEQLGKIMRFLEANAIFKQNQDGAYAHTLDSLDLAMDRSGTRIVRHHDCYWNRLAHADKDSIAAVAEAAKEEKAECRVEQLSRLYVQSRALYIAVSHHLPQSAQALLDARVQAFILHEIPERWIAMGRLEEALLEGAIPFEKANGLTVFEHLGKSRELTHIFSQAMTCISEYECTELACEYEGFLKTPTTLVDVGGGHGRFLQALLQAYPSAQGILFDLAENIQNHILDEETSRRCTFTSGDFFKEVPKGDLYTMKRVLHDWSDEDCVRILKCCFLAAPLGAKLILNELLLPHPSALRLDVYFMALFKGRQRNLESFKRLLNASGWTFESAKQTHCWLSMIIATKK